MKLNSEKKIVNPVIGGHFQIVQREAGGGLPPGGAPADVHLG